MSFIPVDCVALPDNLLESELFGFEKGSFTGADTMHPGLLEYADPGTIFLDEICELKPYLQSKLLRVLQEKEFRRIGGKELIKVDLRIISATNKNPREAVDTGLLREDLYYRLNVIPLEIPPLRDRAEDIPILAEYFLEKFMDERANHPMKFGRNVMKMLEDYPWPGNIRELQNLVERLVSLVDDDTIRLTDLPQNIRSMARDEIIEDRKQVGLSFCDRKKKMIEKFEREYFEMLLSECKGNKSKAARIAQIDRKTLYRRLSVYKS
jgi:transcriptional regulator with PAS, ATPase and Fis domain